jgi:hypothetical protein
MEINMKRKKPKGNNLHSIARDVLTVIAAIPARVRQWEPSGVGIFYGIHGINNIRRLVILWND